MPAPYSPLKQGETDTGSQNDQFLGQTYDGLDEDYSLSGMIRNSPASRTLQFVKNGSGGTITAGMALKWVSGFFGKQVQKATNGAPICGYAPAYVNGSQTATIANGAYFKMVVAGPTTVQTDGNAINEGDIVEAGGTAGQVKTDATVPAANKAYRGGRALAAAAALGTGTQRYVRIDARCNV